jgi:hypothetical protein
MRTRSAIAAITTALTITLVGCSGSSSNSTNSPKPKDPAPTAPAPSVSSTPDKGDDAKTAGIPPEPNEGDRVTLLRALAAANPDIVKYEDKAIDAARNQCSAINSGSDKADWAASQRFTYKDVTTTEAQGKQINEALVGLGFCKT